MCILYSTVYMYVYNMYIHNTCTYIIYMYMYYVQYTWHVYHMYHMYHTHSIWHTVVHFVTTVPYTIFHVCTCATLHVMYCVHTCVHMCTMYVCMYVSIHLWDSNLKNTLPLHVLELQTVFLSFHFFCIFSIYKYSFVSFGLFLYS